VAPHKKRVQPRLEVAVMISPFQYQTEIASSALNILLAEKIEKKLATFSHGDVHDLCKAAWNIARTMNEYREQNLKDLYPDSYECE
jgi:hypothetical protein